MLTKHCKPISIILFVGTILTLPLSLALACSVGNVEIFDLAGMSYLWLLLPFSIIPIVSFVFGIVAVKMGGKAKKNIIAGAAVGFFMIMGGLTSFSVESDRSGSFLAEASAVTGIDLPHETQSASYHISGGRIGNAILIDEGERAAFEHDIMLEPWISELPPACKGALNVFVLSDISVFDRFGLFVSPANVWNPTEFPQGEQTLTLLAYQFSKHRIYVFDSYPAIF